MASGGLSADESTPLNVKKGEKPAEDDGALDPGGPIDIFEWKRIGYLAQYFVVGIIYGGIPATNYGLYICYLCASHSPRQP